MLSYESFVKSIYDKNINNSVVISKEKLLKKMELYVLGGLWGMYPDNVKSFIKFESNDIIFGLNKSVLFTNEGLLIVTVGAKISGLGEWKVFKVDIKNSRKCVTISENKIVIIDKRGIYFKILRCEIQPGKVQFYSDGDSKCSYNCRLDDGSFERIKEVIGGWYEYEEDYENQIIESKRVQELNRIESLNQRKSSVLIELDKNNDGNVDLVEIESLNKLLNKNQKTIIDIDKSYIQKFVKISLYLKTKRSNTQKIFDSLSNSGNEEELNELVRLLKNQVYTYDLLVFHSISMVTSLVDSDLITFYEIYECFDQLGVFNSNWENEVSNKLTNIGDGIRELMYKIHEMENRIVDSIENLTYTTQDSFSSLQDSITTQLKDIDSGIQINNLLTGIQTYQMYKINQNTKRIG